MNDYPLHGKTILITGAARRLGRVFATACARAGADIVIHHSNSPNDAKDLEKEIALSFGRKSISIQADFSNPTEVSTLIARANKFAPLYALVNSASIFGILNWETTSPAEWDRHMSINLRAPFFLSQEFAKQIPKNETGRIVNILDWVALRPHADHFPYTISKAGLAALTKSMALALAPNITVNGIALGAISPPTDGTDCSDIIPLVPMKRWGLYDEIQNALLFLLNAATYTTGEIIHIDGGRHLV